MKGALTHPGTCRHTLTHPQAPLNRDPVICTCADSWPSDGIAPGHLRPLPGRGGVQVLASPGAARQSHSELPAASLSPIPNLNTISLLRSYTCFSTCWERRTLFAGAGSVLRNRAGAGAGGWPGAGLNLFGSV